MTNCLNCGNLLEGKQRKWCSEACRKQLSRRRQSGQKKARQASGLASGNRGAFSPGRIVEMRIVVDSEALYPYLQDRLSLLIQIQHVLGSKAVRDAILEELDQQIPGYSFQVVILTPR